MNMSHVPPSVVFNILTLHLSLSLSLLPQGFRMPIGLTSTNKEVFVIRSVYNVLKKKGKKNMMPLIVFVYMHVEDGDRFLLLL